MTARPPSSPPLLDGYTYLELLGSGGFADVFRYRQHRLDRDVAVKVLLRGVGADTQGRFEAEANTMAKLSNHPSIVSIYAAGVAPDGRPYLVMEHCQPRHLGVRLKQRPYGVGKALEIGIQIAGAVETAHRLRILHRDIKPANILFTDFDRPALTDFGISAADGGAGAAAFSPAWAPPEQIENRPMTPAGDVYSLAVTVWAMITGRNPFEVPGDNGGLALAQRVKTMPVPPTGRPGVPDSLERVLRTAMAKRPEQRYASALEFARALQGVQAELHESVTTIDVREDRSAESFVDETETGTRVTGFSMIDPDEPPPHTASGSFEISDSRGTRPTGHSGGLPPDTGPTSPAPANLLVHGRGSRPAHDPLEFTGPAVPQVPSEDTYFVGHEADVTPDAPVGRRGLLPWLLGLLALVVIGGLVAVYVMGGLPSGTSSTTKTTTTSRPLDPVGFVPMPTDVKGVAQGSSVVFTWTNPDPKPGDTFNYRPVLVDAEGKLTATTETTATLPVQPSKTCILVELVRKGGQYSEMARGCVP